MVAARGQHLRAGRLTAVRRGARRARARTRGHTAVAAAVRPFGAEAQAPAVASAASRRRARYAATFARVAQRSEQYRRERFVEVSMNASRQGAAWHTPSRSMPTSVAWTARPMQAFAPYAAAVDGEPSARCRCQSV